MARVRSWVDVEAMWDEASVPKEMACPLCKKLIRDAVTVPCCGKSYCDEHIREYLLNESHYLTCPNCKEEPMSPDQLQINRHLRQAAEKHVRAYIEEKDRMDAKSEDGKRFRDDDPDRDAKKARY